MKNNQTSKSLEIIIRFTYDTQSLQVSQHKYANRAFPGSDMMDGNNTCNKAVSKMAVALKYYTWLKLQFILVLVSRLKPIKRNWNMTSLYTCFCQMSKTKLMPKWTLFLTKILRVLQLITDAFVCHGVYGVHRSLFEILNYSVFSGIFLHLSGHCMLQHTLHVFVVSGKTVF